MTDLFTFSSRPISTRTSTSSFRALEDNDTVAMSAPHRPARPGGLAPLGASRAINQLQPRVVSVRSEEPHYNKKLGGPTTRPMSVLAVDPPARTQKRPSIPFAKTPSSTPLPSIAPLSRRRTQFIVRDDAPEVPPKDDSLNTSLEDTNEILLDEPGDNFSPTPAFAYAGDAEQTYEPDESEVSLAQEPPVEDIFSVSLTRVHVARRSRPTDLGHHPLGHVQIHRGNWFR